MHACNYISLCFCCICSCLLQGFPAILAFLIPVALCVSVNTVSFVSILRSLTKSGSTITSTKKTSGVEQARRGAAISVYLGLTWISGLLAIRDAKLFFQYLFCIFNSMQGFLIFLFYCVLSTEVRAKYRSRFCNKAPSNSPTEMPISLPSGATVFEEMKPLTAAAEYVTTDLSDSRLCTKPVHLIVMDNANKYGRLS